MFNVECRRYAPIESSHQLDVTNTARKPAALTVERHSSTLDARMEDADIRVDCLVRFIRVIDTDAALRERFCQLAELSPVQRSHQIHIMAEQMAGRWKDSELVDLFLLFGEARIFNAAMLGLRECGYIRI